VHVQIIRDETVWAELEIVEMLLPKGPLGTVEPSARRAFLAEGQYVEGVALSQFDGAATRLDAAQVKASDWLPGTVAAIYGVAPRSSGASAAGLDEVSALVRQVAIREHAARQLKVHPRLVLVWDENTEIVQVAAAARPLNRHRVRVGQDGASWHITDAPEASEAGAAGIDVAGVQAFWQARAASAGTLVEDLTLALLRRFVRSVEIADPAAYTAVAGQGVLYLANHQLDIESVLFVAMIGSLQGTVTTAIARRELHESWVGPYFDICFAHPQIHDMNMLLLIDRESPEAVWAALAGAVEGAGVRANSLLVHVEGKHALKAGQPVEVVSTALIDLAVANGVPIVPLRFAGGLPQEQVAAPLPFPAGYGQQDFRIGAPILPATLAGLPSAARKEVVLRALNGFTEPAGGEQPNAGDPQFAARVAAWRDAQGVSEVQAALWCVLDEAAQVPSSGPDQEAQVSAETQVLRAFVQGETATGAALLAAISPIRRRWLVQAAAELFGLHVALED
jgi:hypothetical protein